MKIPRFSLDINLKPRDTELLSEFECEVCGKIDYRKIEAEWPFMTYVWGNFEAKLVWTCSEKCRTFYTLQKE